MTARPGLSRGQQAAILAIAIGAFLILEGPAWWEPFDYERLWKQILGSYLPIPVLVAGFLWARQRLRALTWLVETTLLVMVKFFVTATFMIAVWALAGPPPREPLSSMVHPLPSRRGYPLHWTPPEPTKLEPRALGAIDGRVVNAAGEPVALAWVHVADLFDDIVFAPREDVVVIEDDGYGPTPAFATVQAGQPLLLRSTDGRLHALRALTRDGHVAFTAPMLREGTPRRLPRAWGELELECTAHREERGGTLLVLSHPFFTRTGEDGCFHLEGIPGSTCVVSSSTTARSSMQSVVLRPGDTVKVDLVLR